MATATQFLFNQAFQSGTLDAPLHPFRVWMVVHEAAQNLQYNLIKTLWQDSGQELALARVKGYVKIDITSFITDLSWSSSTEAAYGDLKISMDNPNGLFNHVPLGTKVQVQTKYAVGKGRERGTKWHAVLETFVFEKDRTGDGDTKTIEFVTHDRLYWLHTKKIHHVYRADRRRHPRGWTATQIIRDLCRRHGIPVGIIDATSHLIKRIELKGTLESQMRRVLKHDKSATGRKSVYTIDMVDGKLNIRRDVGAPPRVAYIVNEADLIESANLSESALGGKGFATRIKMTGKIRTYKYNRRKRRKVSVIKEITITQNPTNPQYQALYGVRVKRIKLRGIHTEASIRKRAKAALANALQPRKELSITCRAIPFLRRGDRVYVVSEYFGVTGLVKVKSASYTLKGNDFSMSLTFDLTNKVVLSAAQVLALRKKLEADGDTRVTY